jgi:hypothetical protein
MFIAPGRDAEMVREHEAAFWRLNCSSQLIVIRKASRHFAESGTLLACQELVSAWCRRHLRRERRQPDLLSNRERP